MPLDFPASPLVGDTYTDPASPYTWICVQASPVVVWDVQPGASTASGADSIVTAFLLGGL